MSAFWDLLKRWFGRLTSWLVRSAHNNTSTLSTSHELDRQSVLNLVPARIPSAGQLKYLPKLLSTRELSLIRIAWLITLISLLILGFRFVSRHLVEVPKNGGTYAEALVGSPQRVNPIYAVANDIDRDLAKLVYSGLFRRDAGQAIGPDLAVGYELSEDEKTYTVKIRTDARWHDGEPVTMNDLLFTFESVQNQAYGSPLSVNFRSIQIEGVDDATLRFTLPEPYAPFLETLTMGILPAHLWSDVPPLNVGLVEYNLKPVGSGPYRFDRLTRDRLGNLKSYELVRNPNYYGRPAYVDQLIFRLYPDFPSAIEAVKSKKVDGISYIPDESRAEVEKFRGIEQRRLNLPQLTAVFFNQKKNEALKDRAVREALALATDKASVLREALGDAGEIVHGPILPGFLGFNPEMRVFPFDPEQARAKLDEAGWRLTDSGVRQKGGQDLKIRLTTSQLLAYEAVVQRLQADWTAVGVGVETLIVETDRIQSDVIKPRDYEALLYGEIVGYDPDPYPFWHSSQQVDPGLGLAIFYNKNLDRALEQARQITNSDERTLKYVEFQNIISEEIPAVFLYQPIYNYGLSQRVKGFATTVIETPSDRFSGVADWYIHTTRVWR